MNNLEELKKRATAAEAVLIERVEALVRESCDVETLKAAVRKEVHDDLTKITEQVHRDCGRDPVHLVLRDVFQAIREYLKV